MGVGGIRPQQVQKLRRQQGPQHDLQFPPGSLSIIRPVRHVQPFDPGAANGSGRR
jgi:hypothetical protein